MIIVNDNTKNKDLEETPEIKKYFSRVFTVMPKEIRDRLKYLDIPKEKKKILKNKVAFLSEKNQIKYLDELERLYD